ncbi:MAG: HU family DNA-binding protein [Acidobacteriota bacterium]
MTRTQFIEALANETGVEKKQAKEFLEAFTAVVERNMKNHEDVPLSGLGKFKVSQRQARTGRNPLTGEPIQIPAKTVVKFTIARALKESVLGS